MTSPQPAASPDTTASAGPHAGGEGRSAHADGEGRSAHADGEWRSAHADGEGRSAHADGEWRSAHAGDEDLSHRVDLVMEGGGVKGIALAGAIEVLEERGYREIGRASCRERV